MQIKPVLILVSGASRPGVDAPPLAFATKVKDLGVASCSGLHITAGAAHDDDNCWVLFPASVLRPWLQPGAPWLTSSSSSSPPPLASDIAICAIDSIAALNDGAAPVCTPVATLRVPAASHAAAQLLQNLNRDASHAQWTFQWSIGGPTCTAAEQGALVLCSAESTGPVDEPKSSPSRSGPQTAALTAVGYAPAASLEVTADKPPPENCSDPSAVSSLRALHEALLSGTTAAVSGHGSLSWRQCSARSPSSTAFPPGSATTAGSLERCSHYRAAPAPGSLVSITGSPFGCLAPLHFLNARVNGAVACAFSAPADARLPPPAVGSCGNTLQHPSADASSCEVASRGAAHSNSADGRGVGPALFALDAHVFPGMEGAPVMMPLQPPCLPSCATANQPPTTPAAVGQGTAVVVRHGAAAAAPAPAPPLAAMTSQRRPLALLCTPLSRRSDGMQVPLALAWPHVEAALLGWLDWVLRRVEAERRSAAAAATAGAGDSRGTISCGPNGSAQAGAEVGREEDGVQGASARAAARQQLALQPADTGPRLTALRTGSCGAAALGGSQISATGPPAWVSRAVVMLRSRGSWATGVIVEGRSGIVITTAHLFQPPQGHAADRALGAAAGGGSGVGDAWADIVCWARVPWVAPKQQSQGGCGDGASELGWRWMRAAVLYVWSNHLDLAVLQLQPAGGSLYGGGWAIGRGLGVGDATAAAAAAPPLAAVQETARAADEVSTWEPSTIQRRIAKKASEMESGRDRDGGDGWNSAAALRTGCAARASTGVVCGGNTVVSCHEPSTAAVAVAAPASGCGSYGTGTPVWSVGHSLIGPSAEWPPLVSYGCVSRVLRRPCGRPTMVLATTTTHAGGSGGALLDAAGRLVGLVTSNARHAGGATLPNMAFCIAAEELEPVLRWAATHAAPAAGGSSGAGRAGRAWDVGAAAVGPAAGAGPGSPSSLAELAALDSHDEDASRIWRLQMPALTPRGAAAGRAAGGGPGSAPGSVAAAAASAQGAGGADAYRPVRDGDPPGSVLSLL